MPPPTFVVLSPRPNVCAPAKPTSVVASVTFATASCAMPVIDAGSVISLEAGACDGTAVAVGAGVGVGEPAADAVELGDGEAVTLLPGSMVELPPLHAVSMAVSKSGAV